MVFEEIKSKMPTAEFYELDPNARYFIVASRHEVSEHAAQDVLTGLNRIGVKAGFLLVDNPEESVNIFELSENE